MFFKVQVLQGPGFQGPGPGFRSSHFKVIAVTTNLLNLLSNLLDKFQTVFIQ